IVITAIYLSFVYPWNRPDIQISAQFAAIPACKGTIGKKKPSLHQLQDGAGTLHRVILLIAFRQKIPSVLDRGVRLLDQLEPSVDRLGGNEHFSKAAFNEILAVYFFLAWN